MSESSKGWVRQLGSETFSVKESIGGVRGAIESLLPGLIFVVAYVLTRDLRLTLILSGGVAVLFVVVRLIQRTPLTQAFTGVLGVAVGVVWAALSGRAENYFAWGLITNVFFGSGFLLTLLIRRPAVGLLVQLFYGLPADWRRQPGGPLLSRRCMWATWVWVGVFAIRIAVQAPLYFGGHVAALGIAKLILGLPLFAVGGWLTWVLLRMVVPTVAAEQEQASLAEKEDATQAPDPVSPDAVTPDAMTADTVAPEPRVPEPGGKD